MGKGNSDLNASGETSLFCLYTIFGNELRLCIGYYKSLSAKSRAMVECNIVKLNQVESSIEAW